MISFLNLQDLLFSASATETSAARTGRKNRHEAVTFPAFIAGAEPAGESRCVGKTARFGGLKGSMRRARTGFVKLWKSSLVIGRDGIRWEAGHE